MEAMTMGIPCIATNVGGIPNYIDNSCGMLTESNNPQMLAEKIVNMIENKKKARILGKNARERMLKYHDLDKNFDKIVCYISKQA